MDVKSVIKAKGFKIEDVANAMGINRVSLSQSLGRNPTIGTLQRIADVVGCKVGDFFADEITPSAPSFFAVVKDGDAFHYTADLAEMENLIDKIKNRRYFNDTPDNKR